MVDDPIIVDDPIVVEPEPTVCDNGVIDDFEDGDEALPEVGGRRGWWFTINDESPNGTQELSIDCAPATDGAEGTDCSARMQGRGFLDWGASLGVNLNDGEGGAQLYDASRHDGVRQSNAVERGGLSEIPQTPQELRAIRC